MSAVIIALLLLFIAIACNCDHVDDLISHINSAQNTWKADRNAGVHVAWRSLLFGRDGLFRWGSKPADEERTYDPPREDGLPEEFDARNNWANCTSIPAVWNQAACSSCWAISAASMISDRICIRSKGEVRVNLSAEHLTSCCEDCSLLEGCQGGDPRSALWYFYNNGLVTGGQYGSKEGCQPYSLQPCSITDEDPKSVLPTCPSSFVNNTPVCERTKCTNTAYYKNFTDDIYRAEWPPYQVDAKEDEIRKEIFQNGPVISIFLAHEDFVYYKTGVYRTVSGQAATWHSARVVGWGRAEDGAPYWWAVNSWGRSWGEEGSFRMLRGADECGFESNVVAITPYASAQRTQRQAIV